MAEGKLAASLRHSLLQQQTSASTLMRFQVQIATAMAFSQPENGANRFPVPYISPRSPKPLTS